jgi:metal-responsive CopG/Arc/MetJ family transcriptional regulator
MEKEFKTIEIPETLYKKIETKIKETGTESVSDYVVKILEKSLSEDQEETLSKEDEEKVKERLKALGYMD